MMRAIPPRQASPIPKQPRAKVHKDIDDTESQASMTARSNTTFPPPPATGAALADAALPAEAEGEESLKKLRVPVKKRARLRKNSSKAMGTSGKPPQAHCANAKRAQHAHTHASTRTPADSANQSSEVLWISPNCCIGGGWSHQCSGSR